MATRAINNLALDPPSLPGKKNNHLVNKLNEAAMSHLLDCTFSGIYEVVIICLLQYINMRTVRPTNVQ